MKSSDEIVSLIEQIVSSRASRDETLREAVRLLKQEREQYNWVGIYLLEGDMLILHNYTGKPTDHTHIPVGRGVCGAAVAERENKIIGDVREIDNYLACSLETRAEIVVLIRRGDSIFGQIDIDSDTANAFNSEDESLSLKWPICSPADSEAADPFYEEARVFAAAFSCASNFCLRSSPQR